MKRGAPLCRSSRGTQPAAGITALRMATHSGQALSNLLPLLMCGEESAARTFEGLSHSNRFESGAVALLRSIAGEEGCHEQWLRGLAMALPPPRDGQASRRAAARFFSGLAEVEPARHLLRIAALDSAVCRILGEVCGAGETLRNDSACASTLYAIQRDEARHARHSLALARAMSGRIERYAIAEHTRHRLVDLLSGYADCFEALSVDARRLFDTLRIPPRGLWS